MKIFTETLSRDSGEIIMLELKNMDKKKGLYEVIETFDFPHQTKCGTELVQYNYCGNCGGLLQKPKDPEKRFEDFKKILFGY